MFKIGEMSKLLGIDRSFLHYYDEVGIVVPQKNEKKYRLYNENDLIAIASAKYYRSMDMPLKSLNYIIQESDGDSKIETMEMTRKKLLEASERMKDIADIAGYAIDLYKMAYQDGFIRESSTSAFDFIPIIEQGKYNEDRIKDPKLQKLLNEFPFVSYTYYFPVGALIDPKLFSYQLGLNVVQEYRKKYQFELPACAMNCVERKCISFAITKNIQEDSFNYDDFEVVRQYAKDHQLELTGEAIAYCVFENYTHDHSSIKFLVQLILK